MGNKKKRNKARTKSVPISPDVAKQIHDHWKAFKEKYGYDPPKDGPMLYDLDADVPTPVDVKAAFSSMLDAMEKTAGIDPAKIYASRKTGRLLTVENAHKVSAAERKEWNDAVDEYNAIQARLKRDSS